MKINTHTNKQGGFTLVELMVGAVIGLFLIGGAISILVTSRQTYATVDDLSRIQENARFAIDLISRDIRMAGFFGCHDTIANVNNNLAGAATAGQLFDTTFGVEGLEFAQGTWLPSAFAGAGGVGVIQTNNGNNWGDAWSDPVNGTPDAITLRFLLGQQITVNGAMATNAALVQIPGNPVGLQSNDLVGVADCGAADVFQITNAAAPTDASEIQHVIGGGGNPWDNTSGNLTRLYGTAGTTIIGQFIAARYYIGRGMGPDNLAATADDIPSLFRRTYLGGAAPGIINIELIEGVEDMQVTYGVDTVGDGLPNTYIPANGNSGVVDLTTIAGWQNVVAVRIGLLFSSPQQTGTDIDNIVRNVNGNNFTAPGDRKRRRVFSMTIDVRNI